MSATVLATRWWQHVLIDPADPKGCWKWKGCRTVQGYGRIQIQGQFYYAHRLALIVAGVDLPEGAWACHHCDVMDCVNPSHLYVGDATSNNRDTVKRGRWRKAPLEKYTRGERHGATHLKVTDVLAIRSLRAAGGTHVSIAKTFGISPSQAARIAHRESWLSVGPQ